MDIHELISQLGFPVVSAVGVAGALWAIMRWVMGSLHRDIGDLHSKLDSQHEYIIRLIDRVRMLEDDVVRTHVLVASIHELRIPLERLGRAKREDS